MEKIIKTESKLIEIRNDQPVTTSQNIAQSFEKRHDHVLRDIDALKDAPNFGEMFFETDAPDTYGRPQRTYLMNRDGFSLLAMGFTGDKALEWKIKYIRAFNSMEAEMNTPEKIMARGLMIAQQTINGMNAQIAEMKPKALFADAVSSSHTSILIGDLAKILKGNGIEIGQKRLFEQLRADGYLIKSGSSKNMPTQKSMDLNLMEVKEGSYINGNGDNITTKTTKITGKGQIYFINKFMNNEGTDNEND
jgi:Rha family phage regulatory protein